MLKFHKKSKFWWYGACTEAYGREHTQNSWRGLPKMFGSMREKNGGKYWRQCKLFWRGQSFEFCNFSITEVLLTYSHFFFYLNSYIYIYIYTECNRRNVRDFGRVFLRSNYADITQNTYIQSWTVTEIMARDVWNFDSYYSLIDYQIHIETGRNMWFL